MSPGPLVVAFALLTSTARADAPTPTGPQDDVTTGRRVAAVLVAVGPGLVVRGAGSWMVGEKRAAKRLFRAGAIGGTAAAFSGGVVGFSGGNPYTIPIGIPLLVVGSGLFLATWPSDIAVAAGVGDRFAQPSAVAPWSIEVGTVWLHDPYRDRGLARLAAWIQRGRIGLGASALLDAENRSRDGDLEARVRLAGAPATAIRDDGSRLEVRSALRAHDDDDDRVLYGIAELELAARLDLARLDDVYRGTFLDLSAGLGVTRIGYAGRADLGTNLLGTFAWGFYLGGRGELTVFYDHRRDHLAGGLAAGRAAGFVGSVGTAVDVRVAPRWAVRGQLELGNASVTTFALRYQGGRP